MSNFIFNFVTLHVHAFIRRPADLHAACREKPKKKKKLYTKAYFNIHIVLRFV